MKISDIRTKDVVKFRNLTNEDKDKIIKFARRISNQKEEMHDYVDNFLYQYDDNDLYKFKFKVDRCKHTQKVPTEYASILTPDNVFIPVQTRYLQVIDRKSRHPLTSIFQ